MECRPLSCYHYAISSVMLMFDSMDHYCTEETMLIDCNHPALLLKIKMHFVLQLFPKKKGEQFVKCMEVEKGRKTIISSATANWSTYHRLCHLNANPACLCYLHKNTQNRAKKSSRNVIGLLCNYKKKIWCFNYKWMIDVRWILKLEN